jgi:hypothetical protein
VEIDRTDPLAYHKARLEGYDPPLINGVVELGYWRLVGADRASQAVVIYATDDGTKVARVGTGDAFLLDADEEPDFFERVFTRCSKLPITEDAYFDVMDALDAGKLAPWPDLPPATMAQFSNLPPSPEEALRQQVASERENVDAWLKEVGELRTQEHVDKAANWAARIAELEDQAEEHRKAAKRPLDEAAKAIQATWCPIRDAAKELVRELKNAQQPFLSEQKRKEEEARRAALAANQAAPTRARVGAGTPGVVTKRNSLTETKRAEIVDFDAALAGFKNNLEVRELVQKLADRVARAGGVPPGCKVVVIESVV